MDSTAKPKPNPPAIIRKLDLAIGTATDFEVAKDFNEELPFMIHCKRCGMPFQKEWRQQRLLYRHMKMYPGDCSAPSQFSVDPRVVLQESLRAVLDKTPVAAEKTVYERLRDGVVHVMVDHNGSAAALHVIVAGSGRQAA